MTRKMQKMRKRQKKIKILPLLLAAAVGLSAYSPGFAYAQEMEEEPPIYEESGEQAPEELAEEEQFPEERTSQEPEETPDPYPPSYYLPVKSNEIPGWPQGPQVQAESAILMDVDYGVCLYEKNIHKKQYPASITKIMTALLTVENANLSDVVTFSENAVYGIEPESSHIGIDAGEQLTVEQCLYGLMLASANEVAMGLAEHVAGSVEAFVEMMNQRAAQLGCKNTHFVNPHGLHDENHYVTAYDMALIAREAFHNRTFLNVVTTVYYEIPPTNMEEETRYLLNHQKLLSDDEWYYTGCRGGKTGYTDQALNTLVTFAKRDNLTLVCVNLKTDGTPIYTDTTALLDYGFTNFNWKNIKKAQDIKAEVPMSALCSFSKDGKDVYWAQTRSPGWVLLPQGIKKKKLTKKRAMEPNAAGPWRIKTSFYYKDQYVGHSYQYENQLLKDLLR